MKFLFWEDKQMSDWQRARKAFTLHWLSQTEKNIKNNKWDSAEKALGFAMKILEPSVASACLAEKISPKIRNNILNICFDGAANFGLGLLVFYVSRQLISLFYFEIFTATLSAGLVFLAVIRN